MAEPVRARRLTDEESRHLPQIVWRAKHGVGPCAPGDDHHDIGAGHAGAGERAAGGRGRDTVRDMIRLFNAKRLAALNPRWAGDRPRLISDHDVEVIVAAARTTPGEAGPAVHAIGPAQAGGF